MTKTRLDRLLSLVESGSNKEIRNAAARQIGEYVRLTPTDAPGIFTKLSALLRSKSWDTRITAADAMQNILEKLAQRDGEAAQFGAPPPRSGTLRLDHLNLDSLIRKRVVLLGCAANVFEAQSEASTNGKSNSTASVSVAGSSKKQQVVNQSDQFSAAANIDMATRFGMNVSALFDEADLAENHDATDDYLVNVNVNEGELERATVDLLAVEVEATPGDSDGGERDANEPDPASFFNTLHTLLECVRRDLFDPTWTVRHGALAALRAASRCLLQLSSTRPQPGLPNKNDTSLLAATYRSALQTEYVVRGIEDAACRLLVLLVVDKFEDFILDEVVAPVRHAAAQCLALTYALSSASVRNAILQHLLGTLKLSPVASASASGTATTPSTVSWEVEHGALLALEHLMAFPLGRTDSSVDCHGEGKESPFKLETIAAVLHRFVIDEAKQDDVRSVAAQLVREALRRGEQCTALRVESNQMTRLWNAVVNSDDLSAAQCSLLRLFVALLGCAFHFDFDSETQVVPNHRRVIVTADVDLNCVLAHCCTMLHHALVAVRECAIEILRRLFALAHYIELGQSQLPHLSTRTETAQVQIKVSDSTWQLAFASVFEQTIIEDNEMVVEALGSLWTSLCRAAPVHVRLTLIRERVATWLCCAMQPGRLAFEPAALSSVSAAKHGAKLFVAGDSTLHDSLEQRDAAVVRARLACAAVQGTLVASLFDPTLSVDEAHRYEVLSSVVQICEFHAASRSAVQRFIACAFLIECARSAPTVFSCMPHTDGTPEQQAAAQLMRSLLERLFTALEARLFFDEIIASFQSVQTEARAFVDAVREATHIDIVRFVTSLPLAAPNAAAAAAAKRGEFEKVGALSFEQIRELVDGAFTSTTNEAQARRITLGDALETRRANLRDALDAAEQQQAQLALRDRHLLAATLVRCDFVAARATDRFNPLVRPLMDAVKAETTVQLQSAAALAVARLVHDLQCSRGAPLASPSASANPAPKIVRNLIAYAANDHLAALPTAQHCVTCALLQNDAVQNTLYRTSLQQRGAFAALRNVVEQFGTSLDDAMPTLGQALGTFTSQSPLAPDAATAEQRAELAAHLFLLERLACAIKRNATNAYSRILSTLPNCIPYLFARDPTIRFCAARALSALCNCDPPRIVLFVLDNVLPPLTAASELHTDAQADEALVARRLGAAECIYHLVVSCSSGAAAAESVCQFAAFATVLLRPTLSAMTDAQEQVRQMAAACFAELLRVLPLDSHAHAPAPATYTYGSLTCADSARLTAAVEKERHFLAQLANPASADCLKLPFKLLNGIELRPYQAAGVSWLWFLNQYSLHGALCDDLGLGKTLQTLCAIAADHVLQRQNEAQSANASGSSSKRGTLVSLIVCPSTLTGHWTYETEKFVDTGVLSAFAYAGRSAEDRAAKFQAAVQRGGASLVVTSYETLRSDVSFLARYSWNYLVLDEGHVIKNAKSKLAQAAKTLRARHRLILTGTPIHNTALDLWSLFDFLLPAYLGSEKQFHQKYVRPLSLSRMASSGAPSRSTGAQSGRGEVGMSEQSILTLEALHRQILPFVMRRMKTDVLRDLPPKIIQDYYCELTPLQWALYDDFMKSSAVVRLRSNLKTAAVDSADADNTSSGGKQSVFRALQFLKKLANHPAFVFTREHPRFSELAGRFDCHSERDLRDARHSGKLTALKQLLEDVLLLAGPSSPDDAPASSNRSGQKPAEDDAAGETQFSDHRCLIFCQSKLMLDAVQQLLANDLKGVRYLRLDGDVKAEERFRLVREFNDRRTVHCLLLTTAVGGLGLNLTGADTVIFVEHDWNPVRDLQAMDRAHRIGQTRTVSVYRLITRHTIEEKILGLQQFKLKIANTVVTIENSDLEFMQTDRLFDLFEDSVQDQRRDGTERNRDETTSSKAKRARTNVEADEYSQLNTDDLRMWSAKEEYDAEFDLNSFLQSL